MSELPLYITNIGNDFWSPPWSPYCCSFSSCCQFIPGLSKVEMVHWDLAKWWVKMKSCSNEIWEFNVREMMRGRWLSWLIHCGNGPKIEKNDLMFYMTWSYQCKTFVKICNLTSHKFFGVELNSTVFCSSRLIGNGSK